MNKEIMVVGAGVAGLTAAHKLAENGYRVVLIEKENKVGGLARTFRYGDYSFDIGPHRFYSSSQQVLDYINHVMNGDMLSILRLSAVYYCNQYHTWPLRLRSVFQMPPTVSIPAFFDLFTKGKYKKLKDPTFKNFILSKYGKTLYETFFQQYTEKFIGTSPEKIHYHWAKIGVERATIDDKIQTGSISQLFRLMLMPKPRQLNFLYPPGGCDVFCERIRDKIQQLGGRIITGCMPSMVEHDGQNITLIKVGDEVFNPEMVIWTAPVTDLFDLMGFRQPGLQYLALLIYNLELSESPLQNYQWCYFGSREQLHSRATNPAEFGPGNVPKGKGALCAEVTCQSESEQWMNPEKNIDRIIGDLAKTRSIRDKKVVRNVHIERIPNTYPVYDIDYLSKLGIVREKLQKIHNLFLAGRTGLFWYNNMDHSIENALTVADKVMGHSPETAYLRMEDPFHLGAAVGDPSCAAV